MATEVIKRKVESANQDFKFYSNGKITIKRKVKNPFEIIAGVVFRDER